MNKIEKILKGIAAMTISVSLTFLASVPAFAQWTNTGSGIKWLASDGTTASNVKMWIDEDGDGTYKQYAFDANGYLITNKTVNGDVYGSTGARLNALGLEDAVKYTEGQVPAAETISAQGAVAALASNSQSSINPLTGGITTKLKLTLKKALTTGIDASQIVTSKYQHRSGSTVTTDNGPDMSQTSYETFSGLAAAANAGTVTPTIDQSINNTINGDRGIDSEEES